MPTVTFNTIQDLITYINQFIIVNHNNEITGEQHNNVENGLSSFIISSPRNYNKAYVTSVAAAFVAVASQCVLVFKPGATGSIQLIDNKWNEWVIYNNSGANKTLVGAIPNYVSQTGTVRNYAPAGKVLCLAKGNDNVWYEIATNTNTTTSNTNFVPLEFKIGGIGSPMTAGQTVLEIVVNNAIQDSEFITLDNAFMPPNRNDQISYGAAYTTTKITITFNQGVIDGQNYYIKYATTS